MMKLMLNDRYGLSIVFVVSDQRLKKNNKTGGKTEQSPNMDISNSSKPC